MTAGRCGPEPEEPHEPITCVKCGDGALNTEPRVALVLVREEQRGTFVDEPHLGSEPHLRATLKTSNEGFVALILLLAGPERSSAEMEKFSRAARLAHAQPVFRQ